RADRGAAGAVQPRRRCFAAGRGSRSHERAVRRDRAAVGRAAAAGPSTGRASGPRRLGAPSPRPQAQAAARRYRRLKGPFPAPGRGPSPSYSYAMELSRTLRARLKNLPDKPGVYLHKAADGTILYVGKAKSLRNRVRSYFNADFSKTAKQRSMLSQVVDVDYVLV